MSKGVVQHFLPEKIHKRVITTRPDFFVALGSFDKGISCESPRSYLQIQAESLADPEDMCFVSKAVSMDARCWVGLSKGASAA